MTTYGLGIDTGGTYTDSVIVDMGTDKVICFNKALTTRHDLVEGIRNSLGGLDRTLLEQVTLTSLSSTLATSSVVENKRASVGIVTIGKEFDDPSRPQHYINITGRFRMNGEEEIPLDLDTAAEALAKMRGHVDALAVAGYLSVRNPAHELRIAELADEILGVPVVCAHALTSQLGFAQRTVTAVMNAGLIPIIHELLDSVKTVLREFNVSSPLMMVKGDGSLMNSETASRRPVDTILSGPASSMMGAMAMARVKDALVIDMGGTTVDLGLIRNGLPRIDEEGACLGGRRTRVRAANVSAFGIGGDSRILVNGRDIMLSSVRAIPLCIASRKWPSVREAILELSSVTDDRSPDNGLEGDILQETELFTLGGNRSTEGLGHLDVAFLGMLSEGPMRASEAGRRLSTSPHAFSLARMEERGNLIRIGFTPTDVLHAAGTYVEHDRETALVAADYLSRKCNVPLERFLEIVQDRIVCRIASCVMEKAMLGDSGTGELSTEDRAIIDRTLHPVSEDYALQFRLRTPMVGIGAPVCTWLPPVAERLGAELILPEHSSIGNALGAICGSVVEVATVSIRADSENLSENVGCRVFSGKGIRSFDNQQEALDFAKEEASRMALEAAIASGAVNPEVEVSVEETIVELCSNKRFFRGAEVCARATGKPDFS
ncbi:MAG: hydantoinase/oxoprolinase family protein [archaeon]|nr:hydantoinase/oxoprolinase family protein [archaeon]